MAAFGLVPDGEVLPEPEAVYLWPENLPAWQLWLACQPLWRGTGMQREGLDRPGVHATIGERRQWRLHRRRLLANLRVMEQAVLQEWAEKAEPAGGGSGR